MVDAKQDGAKVLAPPYVAFSTTKTFLGTLKEHGVPSRIDRSVLGNFSGQVGSQLITALRFLHLIDADNHPTQRLVDLVSAYGTDNWGVALDATVRGAYGPLVDSNLSAATPAQFHDRFRALYTAEGDTLRKCMTFFLAAANEAGIPISPYIMKNKKPRTAPTKKRTPKPKETPLKDNGEVRGPGNNTPGDTTQPTEDQRRQLATHERLKGLTAEQMLIEILDPATMDAEEQQAVFKLLLFLKKQKSGSAQ